MDKKYLKITAIVVGIIEFFAVFSVATKYISHNTVDVSHNAIIDTAVTLMSNGAKQSVILMNEEENYADLLDSMNSDVEKSNVAKNTLFDPDIIDIEINNEIKNNYKSVMKYVNETSLPGWTTSNRRAAMLNLVNHYCTMLNIVTVKYTYSEVESKERDFDSACVEFNNFLAQYNTKY